MNDFRRILKPENLNILFLSFISILESLQVLMVAVAVFHFFPLRFDLKDAFLPFWKHLVQPEREMMFYRLWVLAAIGVQACLLIYFRNRLDEKVLVRKLCRFFTAEIILVGAMLFVLFKMAVGGMTFPLKVIFYVLLGTAMVAKVSWRHFDILIGRWMSWPGTNKNAVILNKISDAAVPVLIFLLVYIPDINGLLAKIFNADHLHHIDAFVAAPALAFLKGGIFGTDIYTQYGMGLPALIGMLATIGGNLSYQHLLCVFIAMTMLYLILIYFLLRIWLKDPLISLIGILFILKFHIFNNGINEPIIWRYPSQTVIRYFFDVLFFISVFLHLNRGNVRYLLFAGICSGFSLWYVFDVGVYLF